MHEQVDVVFHLDRYLDHCCLPISILIKLMIAAAFVSLRRHYYLQMIQSYYLMENIKTPGQNITNEL